jgi:hypothetical protein
MGNSVKKPDLTDEDLATIPDEIGQSDRPVADNDIGNTDEPAEGRAVTHEQIDATLDPDFEAQSTARIKSLEVSLQQVGDTENKKPEDDPPKKVDFYIGLADGEQPAPDDDEDEKVKVAEKYTKLILPGVPAPQVLQDALTLIKAAPGGESVKIQQLSRESEVGIQRFLDKHLNTATARRVLTARELLQLLNKIQSVDIDSPELKSFSEAMKIIFRGFENTTKGYYEFVAQLKAQLNGRIVSETLALMNHYLTVADYLRHPDNTPRRICSIGPGDGDALRGAHKIRRIVQAFQKVTDHIKQRGYVKKGKTYDVIDQAVAEQVMPVFYFDPALLGVDITDTYPETLWSERNIQAISCDAGSPDLVGKHKIGKKRRTILNPTQKNRFIDVNEGEWDQFLLLQVLDRVPDRLAIYDNIKRLASPGARFTLSLPVEITSENNVGGRIVHWDKSTDPRNLWIHPHPERAIFYQYLDIAMNGLKVDVIGMQKYISLNPECEIDFADNLRRRKKELEEKYCKDGKGERIHLQILANLFNCSYPEHGIEPTFIFDDEDAVMFPEVHDVTLFSGVVDKDADTMKD